jgi:hypothetical protein
MRGTRIEKEVEICATLGGLYLADPLREKNDNELHCFLCLSFLLCGLWKNELMNILLKGEVM